MADDSIPWGALIDAAGSLIQTGAGYMAKGQQIGASDEATGISKDAYMRALALLQGGQLGPKFSPVAPISRPTGDVEASLAQRDALLRLQEASREGFNTIDRAAINRAMSEANQNERMQREAAMARLDPNSGAAMAARLGAQQSSANRANQQALDIAAASRQRALQSLGAYGNLASNMRNQEFGEQSSIDKFNAELSRFNSQGGLNAQQYGIGNQLAALGAAGVAGQNYGQGIMGTGNLRAQQTYGLGTGIAGGLGALGPKIPKRGGTSQPPLVQANGGGLNPDELENPFEYDDEHGLK